MQQLRNHIGVLQQLERLVFVTNVPKIRRLVMGMDPIKEHVRKLQAFFLLQENVSAKRTILEEEMMMARQTTRRVLRVNVVVRPMLSLGLLGHVLQLCHILAAHEAYHTLSVK